MPIYHLYNTKTKKLPSKEIIKMPDGSNLAASVQNY